VVERRPPVGTVNVVVEVPQRLSDAALVNAVATVTEAKAQAIAGLGLAATGTPTDAVCVLCPPHGPVAVYGGPRSRWGAPLARAVHRAVIEGGRAFLAGATATAKRHDRAP
jgi:adenosylcobinamide amidohydrolase